MKFVKDTNNESIFKAKNKLENNQKSLPNI